MNRLKSAINALYSDNLEMLEYIGYEGSKSLKLEFHKEFRGVGWSIYIIYYTSPSCYTVKIEHTYDKNPYGIEYTYVDLETVARIVDNLIIAKV